MTSIWTQECEALLSQLKEEILAGPVLARPDTKRRFYLKTDWSKDGMGPAVLLQADDSEGAREAEASEADGGKCLFDRTIEGLRLRPIAFISRRTQTAVEKSSHSYVGEAATIRWAVVNFINYLFGASFTVLTDC